MNTTATTANALDICNACDVEDQHSGCSMGYCTGCCPATPTWM